MTEKKAPSDGVITGYGVIDGNLVYVYSQDVSVLNGTVGEMHAKKITRLYDMAMKTGAPVIGLIDCAGLRLQEATDALEAFGEIYMKQTLASGPPCLRQEEWHQGHIPGFFSAKYCSLRRKCFREGLQEQQSARFFLFSGYGLHRLQFEIFP